MAVAHQPRRWSREEYERLVEAGIFKPDDRVELIDGEILTISPQISPQSSPHATAVLVVRDRLSKALGAGFSVRDQLPLALADDSEPEPDVAVVEGSPRDYRESHPHSALLVVEVADTSLAFDRSRKKELYARAGIHEYWVLDLSGRTLEVYRGPQGNHYRSAEALPEGASVRPLAASGESIAIADLLP